MNTWQATARLGVAVLTVWTSLCAFGAAPALAAASCPDVQVVFARGTTERAGVGVVGKAFVATLAKKLSGKTVTSYAVDYPANFNFSKSTSEGAVDANNHVQTLAAACPRTKIVLGGMSQGAGVIDLISIGEQKIWFFTPSPMPDSMVGHVAAIAVFGNPSRNLRGLGPLTTLSPLYGSRTIDLCALGDPYCSAGINLLAHLSYPVNGMVDQAATFAARRVLGKAG